MPDIGDLLSGILPFRPGPTSITSGLGSLPSGWRSGPTTFVPRSQRFLGLAVDVNEFNLPTLPDRMVETLHQRLVVRMGEAADKVIGDAKKSLYKPAGFPKERHGVDTGKMRDSLVAKLVEEVGVVSYDLSSSEADYWVYVEFGHMLRDGSWWPGYHFLTSALLANYRHIQSKAREAVHDTMVLLAAQARFPAGGAAPLPPSSSSLGPTSPSGLPLEQG